MGRYAALTAMQRVKHLEGVQMMLCTMKAGLEYSAAPLENILDMLCERGSTTQFKFLHACKKACEEGYPFPKAWKSSLTYSNTFPLKEEDTAHLLSLGEILGTTDLLGQIQSIELHSHMIEQQLNEAREESKKKSKLFPALGLLVGTAVSILLF